MSEKYLPPETVLEGRVTTHRSCSIRFTQSLGPRGIWSSFRRAGPAGAGTGPEHFRPDRREPFLFLVPKKGVAVFPREAFRRPEGSYSDRFGGTDNGK